MPVAVVVRVAVVDRRVEASMEVTPVVMEMRPVIGVTISVAIAAAMEDARRAITAATEHRRGTKAAAVDRTASEPAAMERSTAAPEPTAMKPATAEATTAAAKTAASTTTETTAAAMTAVADFGRQIVGCKFC